jgi:prepilin-type N-terminal cleavage/methylation domain-containing protein
VNRSHSQFRAEFSKGRFDAGFSLIELMIAMSVFLVIGGTAMSLFRQNTVLYTDQQGTTALNVSLRNSLTQIQNDVVNAANGYYSTGIATAGWSFGITAKNNSPGYDVLNVLVPAAAPAQIPAATCIDTTAGTGLIVPPAGVTAANFTANNEVLFINGAGNQFTTGMLTGATTSGTNIKLNFQPTAADGTNSAINDPLGVSTYLLTVNPNTTDTLGTSYCTGDWVVLIGKTTFTVDGANQLTRQVGAGAAEPIADQIIGFKVGVSLFNSAGFTSGAYLYDNSYATKSRSIRSVRVSVIGRTPPGQWSGTNFANSFDGGNYKIEALSLVINPRNLSMNDCGSCN